MVPPKVKQVAAYCAKPSLLIADYRREQAITRVPLSVVTKPDVVELVGTGGFGLGQ